MVTAEEFQTATGPSICSLIQDPTGCGFSRQSAMIARTWTSSIVIGATPIKVRNSFLPSNMDPAAREGTFLKIRFA